MPDATSRLPRPTQSDRGRIVPQLVKFGLVGGVGFVVNVVVFNALMILAFNPSHVEHASLIATASATFVAIFINWLGNRYWAFSDQRRASTAREGAEFFVVSLLGMLIPLGCVWVSHYLLGHTSLLADNIANNVVGLGLGMIFRFALYRWWVFSPSRRTSEGESAPEPVESAVRINP